MEEGRAISKTPQCAISVQRNSVDQKPWGEEEGDWLGLRSGSWGKVV